MDRERRHKVSEIFEEALDVAADARPGFLDGACAGDPWLRREVAALLEALPKAEAVFRSALASDRRRRAQTRDAGSGASSGNAS